MRHELWPHRVCTADRASAPQGVSQVRGPLSWKPLREKLLLLGSVSGHGLRPAHLSRKPTRHRDLPGGGGRQAVPHGLPQPGGTLDAGRCQRIARLAHLRRLCADSDSIARPLYARDAMGVDLDESLYALDSTTIDLCLALFPWARFRRHKAAVKMHTLLDLRGNIPAFVH